MINNLDCFVTVKEIDSEKGEYVFLDYQIVKDTDTDTDSGISEISFKPTKNEFELVKLIEENDLKTELIENIITLADKAFDRLVENSLQNKFIIKNEDSEYIRKVQSTIISASSMIAVNGRIGPANNLLISKENYIKYDIQNVLKINVFFTDIKDIIVYRRNDIQNPGLMLFHNNEKYLFKTTGFQPETQFMKVVLDF